MSQSISEIPVPAGVGSTQGGAGRLLQGLDRLRRLGSPLAVLLAWQLVSEFGVVSREVLPPPTQVLAAFGELWAAGELQRALPASISRSLLGPASRYTHSHRQIQPAAAEATTP